MIYITGDTHGDPLRFAIGAMQGEEKWGVSDHLIVCGDFGYVFSGSYEENDLLDYLETKPYTICFCDGNHENFSLLNTYPREMWNGGKVHRIRKNILHLMRGQVFSIDDKTVFAMGGAYSIDRYLRVKGISYWDEELPTGEEYHEAINNLKVHDNTVDLIVSHTAPKEIVYHMGHYPDAHDMELTGFLDWVMHEVTFSHWYFGHWHRDETYYKRFTAVYEAIHTVKAESEWL